MPESITIRLHADEIVLLKKEILQRDPTAKVYLFGSRCDPLAKGGDIDILILSAHFTPQQKREVRVAFFKKFGEQKLDIVIDSPTHPKTFTKLILKKAVHL